VVSKEGLRWRLLWLATMTEDSSGENAGAWERQEVQQDQLQKEISPPNPPPSRRHKGYWRGIPRPPTPPPPLDQNWNTEADANLQLPI